MSVPLKEEWDLDFQYLSQSQICKDRSIFWGLVCTLFKRTIILDKEWLFEVHIFTLLLAPFFSRTDQLLDAQWVLDLCLKIDKLMLSKENIVDFRILPNV